MEKITVELTVALATQAVKAIRDGSGWKSALALQSLEDEILNALRRSGFESVE